jgi:hypothetical protein
MFYARLLPGHDSGAAAIKVPLTQIPKGSSIQALYRCCPRRGAMRDNISEAVDNRSSDHATAGQRNPLNWLIVGGILLIAAITIGTAFTIVSFPDEQRART